MSSFDIPKGIFLFVRNSKWTKEAVNLNRIQMLLSQIDCIDQMITIKIENERNAMNDEFFTKLVNTHQKVSLAEKHFHVKNTCSPS